MTETPVSTQTPETDLVHDELEGHTTAIENWITKIEALETPKSYKTVVDRFVRDCRTTITDIKQCEQPSTNDLNDFENRINSLESQYYSLTEEVS